MRYRLVLACVLAAATACVKPPPTEAPLPDYASEYVFNPTLIDYEYKDSTPGSELSLLWRQDSTFAGFNCLQLIPRTPTDSIGNVRWVYGGLNRGRLERRIQNNAPDSTDAFFLPPINDFGTRGNYLMSADGSLTFNWTNGSGVRYFDPAAVIRVVGDTIFSDITSSFTNGFVRWHVAWILTTLSCS